MIVMKWLSFLGDNFIQYAVMNDGKEWRVENMQTLILTSSSGGDTTQYTEDLWKSSSSSYVYDSPFWLLSI